MYPVEEIMRSVATGPLAAGASTASKLLLRLLKRPIVQHRTPQGRWMPISPPTRVSSGVHKYRLQRDGSQKPRHTPNAPTRLMEKELERVEVERMQLVQGGGLPSRKSLRKVLMPNLRNCRLSTTDYDPEGKLDFVCRVATTRHTACKRKLDCSIHLVGDKQNVRRSRLWDDIWSEYGEVFGIRGDESPHGPHQAAIRVTPLPSPTESPTPLLDLQPRRLLLSGLVSYLGGFQDTVLPSDLSLTPCPPLILSAAKADCQPEGHVLGTRSPSPGSWEHDSDRAPHPWSVLPLAVYHPPEISVLAPMATPRFPPGFSNNGLLLTKPTVVHPLLHLPGIFQAPWVDAPVQPAPGDARLSFPEEWMDIDRPLLPPVIPNYSFPLPEPSLEDTVAPAALQSMHAASTGVLAYRVGGVKPKRDRKAPVVRHQQFADSVLSPEPPARLAKRGLGITVACQGAAFPELVEQSQAPPGLASPRQGLSQDPPPMVLRESPIPPQGVWLLMRLIAIHLADPPVAKIVAGYLLLELRSVAAMTEEERLPGFCSRSI